MNIIKAIDQMSTEELQALLDKRQQDDTERKRNERKEYEKDKEAKTSRMLRRALKLNSIMTQFYNESVETLEGLRDKLNAYGEIKSNSKGGFQLKTKEGDGKVVYKYSTLCDWDERAVKAEDLLKDFLSDVVKKKNKEHFELIIGLIEKNKEGKLELSRMQALYAKESLFSDPRWVEAIRLFKESFRPVSSKMRLEFYKRTESGKWELISLNISSF